MAADATPDTSGMPTFPTCYKDETLVTKARRREECEIAVTDVMQEPKGRVAITQTSTNEDCLFCKVISVPPHQLSWFDRPLMHVPHVGAVIAGLGAFAPGYVLVFPEQHVESTLRLGKDDHPLFIDLLEATVKKVTAAFDSPTIFEHGSCVLERTRRSACLDHAHIHLLPGSYRLSDCAQEDAAAVFGRRRPAVAELTGYLFLQEPGAEPVYLSDPGISQYFRRQVAARIDLADEWDYLLFPRLENVLETINRFPPTEAGYRGTGP
jgi:diadenosine tetraphosphate (Ap4A) HIT family hydrolase